VLLRQKPDETKHHPDDISAFIEAEESLGDYKLKSARNYRVPKHLHVTVIKKYDQLLEARKRVSLILKNISEQNIILVYK
jgi:hypothetical protein